MNDFFTPRWEDEPAEPDQTAEPTSGAVWVNGFKYALGADDSVYMHTSNGWAWHSPPGSLAEHNIGPDPDLVQMQREPEAQEQGRSEEQEAEDVTIMEPYLSTHAGEDARQAGTGLSTGFPALDLWHLRWQPGKVYALAARPSEGKTTILVETAMRAVERSDTGTVVFVSYEENRHDLYVRLLQREYAKHERRLPVAGGGTEPWAPSRHDVLRFLATGSLPAAENPTGIAARWVEGLRKAATRLDVFMAAGRLVLVDGDHSGGSVDVLLDKLSRATRARGAPPLLLLLDYFQKIKPPTALRGAPRQQQLQATADRLRSFAKGDGNPAHAVPVIAAAQINREGVEGQPQLHQIREADDLANDCAAVLTLHRPENGNTLHILGAKNRDGERGRTTQLRFFGGCNVIEDVPAGQENETAVAEHTRRTAQARPRGGVVQADTPVPF